MTEIGGLSVAPAANVRPKGIGGAEAWLLCARSAARAFTWPGRRV